MIKILYEAWNKFFLVETLLDIGFHTLSLMNSTYPSTIWDKSSASYTRTLAKNSMSAIAVVVIDIMTKSIKGMDLKSILSV